MSGSLTAVRRTWRAARDLFGRRAWIAPPPQATRGQRALLRGARLAQVTVGALLSGTINLRAAALTYFSVLSLVPLLAFAFSVLKVNVTLGELGER